MSNKLIYANLTTTDHEGNLNNSKIFIDKILAINEFKNKEYIAIELRDGVRKVAKCTFQEFLDSIERIDLEF